MNDEEGLFSTRDSLPEEVKKNTVAMGKNKTHEDATLIFFIWNDVIMLQVDCIIN